MKEYIIKDNILTVTQFVELMDTQLGAYDGITVEGEVDEFKISQGKWVRMVLKDERSHVRCFMPTWDLHTAIEDGMKVRVTGKPKMTEKWGFSFNLYDVQPAGEGALRRALLLLQNKLTQEGLFAAERKRALPRFPRHIALITSSEAAAYADFMKVLQARQGGLTISFINSQVQGEDAPRQLVEALEIANTVLERVDALVMVRGGGSLDDLQAFNDERVVRAVAGSRTPTIVGIGHERDVTLAELAADVRASTPSNAAELLVETREAIMMEIAGMRNFLSQSVLNEIARRERAIQHLTSVMQGTIQVIGQAIVTAKESILRQEKLMPTLIWRQLETEQRKTAQMLRIIESFSPRAVLQRGYSITKTADGRVLRRAGQVGRGDRIVTALADGEIGSRVEG